MLTVYELQQSKEWDAIVRTFKDYDVYWLSGYVKGFQIHGDGEPLLFYYEDENTRGINVVMKRDIAADKHFAGKLEEGKYFDFATPYGYGGWLIEGDDTKTLFDEYFAWCKDNGIVSEFVRFHPVIKNHHSVKDSYEVIPLGKTVTMDISSPKVIWANLTSKNRNKIRKAQKNGVTISHGLSEELFHSFMKIYNSTMDKDNATDYYYFKEPFYKSIYEDLADNAEVFYAEAEDKIIAASIMLITNGRMNYHLSGSIKEYTNMAPTNMLLYEAALWGADNGCKTLYLGGGVGSGDDSLFEFKKSFYRVDDYPVFQIGRVIFDSERYDELVKERAETIEGNFFPKYRA